LLQITSFREPSIPPPPAPTRYQETSGLSTIRQPPATSVNPMSSARPPLPAQQSAWNSGRGSGAGAHQNSGMQPSAAQEDDWDDSWDDDDDNSSTTNETQVANSVTQWLMTNVLCLTVNCLAFVDKLKHAVVTTC